MDTNGGRELVSGQSVEQQCQTREDSTGNSHYTLDIGCDILSTFIYRKRGYSIPSFSALALALENISHH